MLFPRNARRRAFLTKTRTIILFTPNTTLNRLGFGVTPTGQSFRFRNNEMEDTVAEPKKSCGSWTLFVCYHFRWVYVTRFGHRNLGERSGTTHFLLWFIPQKAALVFVEEKRVHNTQLSVRRKGRTHFEKACLQGFKYYNTDFNFESTPEGRELWHLVSAGFILPAEELWNLRDCLEGREGVKWELGLALFWIGKMGFTHWDWDLATGNGMNSYKMGMGFLFFSGLCSNILK